MPSLNFEVLRQDYPKLADLGEFAERYVHSDPSGAAAKLRTYGRALAHAIYAHYRLPRSCETNFELLISSNFESIVPEGILSKFHAIRKMGNIALYPGNPEVTQRDAISRLRDAHDLAKWWAVQALHCDLTSLVDFQVPPLRPALPPDVQDRLREQEQRLEEALAALENRPKQYPEVKQDDARLKVLRKKGEESAYLLSLMPGESGISIGVQLFRHLAQQANRGKPTGISYGDFIAHLHGKNSFKEVAGRNYLPGDSGAVIRLAGAITQANGGRITVAAGGLTIQSGMDTYIWASRTPYDRSEKAWQNLKSPLPYSRSAWETIFPRGQRRVIKPVSR